MDPFEALVLQSHPYRETSALLTLLTPDRGVVRALAKGVHRAGPRRAAPAALEPMAWIEGTLSLRTPDALGTLGPLTLHCAWPGLRGDPARWAFASLGIEVLWKLAAASPPDAALFNEGCAYLALLEQATGPGSLTALLLLRLLHYAGFPPQVPQAWTIEALPPSVVYDFSSGTLAVAAGAGAGTGTGMASSALWRVPPALLVALWPALQHPPALDPQWTLAGDHGRAALRWLIALWEDHLGTRLASAHYLETMVLRAAQE